jgi:hypothetical protein
MDRDRPIELLNQVKNALAVELNGLTAQLPGLALQGCNQLAVIQCVGQSIAAGYGAAIQAKAEIEFKPLTLKLLKGEHPHVAPKLEPPHMEAIALNGHG